MLKKLFSPSLRQNRNEIYSASLLDVQGSLKLSEVADSVWYIPLETNENSLLGDLWAEGKMRYAGGQFYIYDGQQGSICSFAADGQFLSRIGKKGQGDGEIFHFSSNCKTLRGSKT